MRFNWERSIPCSFLRLPGGYYQIQFLGFIEDFLKIRACNVRFTTTKHLHDSSVQVVDLGPKGRKTGRVVIATDTIERLKSYFRYQKMPLPRQR